MSDFRHRAACRDRDPELFFPVGTGDPARRQTVAAKGVCRRCPVSDACLTWAVRTGQAEGIWGGRTPDERRAVHVREPAPQQPAQVAPLPTWTHSTTATPRRA